MTADPFAGGARLADGQVLSLAGMPESRGRITLAIRPGARQPALTPETSPGEVEEVVYIGTDTLYLLKVAGTVGLSRAPAESRWAVAQPLPAR